MSSRFHLTIQETDGERSRVKVTLGTYAFGRDPACQVVLRSMDVSRRHARMSFEETSFIVEDMGSASGTTVNDLPVGKGKRFTYPQIVMIGGVAVAITVAEPASSPPKEPAADDKDGVRITIAMDAAERGQVPMGGVAGQMAARLAMLYDLPLQFAAEPDLRKLYKLILNRVMELIPGARRGALLIIEPATGKLALRASEPEEFPPISRTLIQRAARDQQGFIWGDDDSQTDTSMSIVNLHIRTGMYVPLLWQGRTVGVLCVDNPRHRAAFRQEDLQFMISVAHYAASAVANQLLQDDIETNNRTLQHLLANFSPKLRGKLMQKARDGKLQPGGEKSDVTILMSDLRGFTRTSANLDSAVVVDMLNDYFSVLGDIIFQHDGTIDKFIGDAILAVFGSPEMDEQHPQKAVRAAVQMQVAIKSINERRRAEGLPCCDLGIGVHTGEVLHGFIGAAERLEFTVIGDTVNKASRYCDGAAAGEIVLGPRTQEAIQAEFETMQRRIGTKHEGDLQAWALQIGNS